jgi:hypothetical protein
VFEVEDQAEMDRILAENPACRAGALRATAKPYRMPSGSPSAR